MKTKILTLTLFILIAFWFTSCSKKTFFLQSSVLPAAEGYVEVSRDKSENYKIKLELKNFAGADRLDPSNLTYVVWMVTAREAAINIGRIITSNSLNVSFETLSSFRPVKIFITAEEQENARYPGSMVILSTDRF
ncbi:MAG: hypothetical protein P1P83_08080 [Bacteroidales bacterium]|nr:hypothetical protein [Bacteroidales bacterium]MDT8373515.1 hypothetical protein [Bacteroidales bacterium]